jgi:hypothetical protein
MDTTSRTTELPGMGTTYGVAEEDGPVRTTCAPAAATAATEADQPSAMWNRFMICELLERASMASRGDAPRQRGEDDDRSLTFPLRSSWSR